MRSMCANCADHAFDAVDTIPDVLTSRPLSVRAFDAEDMMIEADLCEGAAVRELLDGLLADPKARYLQVHYARRGCYAARVERA